MATTNRNYKQSRFMTDAIMESSQIAALGFNEGSQVANVARSGQLGVGLRSTKLDGSTPAVFNPAAAIVLNTPQIFDNIPNASECLRALMETHAKSITGIDVNYTVETGETQVGHDGQVLKVPTKTTRAQISPSVTFEEYQGLPVWNLFREWMFAMQHPDTNMSAVSAYADKGSDIPGWCISAFSMSMLFIQFDPTGLPDRIYDAVVVNNMFPTSIGEMGIQRVIGTTDVKERTIEFTGLIQHNRNTKLLGQRVAAMLGIHRVNFDFALPGMAGSVEPDTAISTSLRNLGGMEYEVGNYSGNGTSTGNSKAGSANGTATEFKYKGTGNAVVKDGGANWFTNNRKPSAIAKGHAGEANMNK